MTLKPESIFDDGDHRRISVITKLAPVLEVFFDGGDGLIDQAVSVQAGFDGLQAAREMDVEPVFLEGADL